MQGEQHEPLSTRKSLEREAEKRSGYVGVSWYDETSGKRTYKKRNLGTVKDLPSRRDAEQAVADFRANINVEVRVPVTV